MQRLLQRQCHPAPSLAIVINCDRECREGGLGLLVYGLGALIYVLDQWVKYVVRSHMYVGQVIPVVPHVLVLDYIRNPGAAWGMLGGSRWLLVFIAVIVVGVVVYIRTRYKLSPVVQIGLGLLLGGAIGNLTDRIVFGNVIDYIYFIVIHYPVFNLADSAIVVGVLIILAWNLFGEKRSGTERTEENR